MANDLVAYSRAGDVFHYRWAARRCLQLVYPNSTLKEIIIEGSAEQKKEGEYVIDVTEYSEVSTKARKIDYYQLKHSEVQLDEPFTLSDLKDTFEGFAKRFLQHKEKMSSGIDSVSFSIITNRNIADSFKKNISAIINEDQKVDVTFKTTIEKYTSLTSNDLALFCGVIKLEDGEGNYNVQKDELRIEIAQLQAGSVENAQIDSIVALVQDKVLPNSDGRITREDILKRFGITSERDLYPAPAVWEDLENIIERKQHSIIKDSIVNSTCPVIVHAAGGVGKSVFCRQFMSSLEEGSLAISYDCFGAGSYRNRSEPRHRHRDALVQIINELATKGLCDPLIVQDTTRDEDIMRKFLLRIDATVKSLRKTTPSADLIILVDAADNAEMAAKEFGHPCFAHELLREKIHVGCKLVLLCRTERIFLLQPSGIIPQFELVPFSENETLENLRKWFPLASEKDGLEFHRLTNRNPRVQANALDVKYDSIDKLLNHLGPYGTTVEKQIELQLNSAVSKLKDNLPLEFRNHINAICVGLASLPPHIPIDVLSTVANVSIVDVKSFVADIGRSLWLSDTSVQFRDEPTETWFRKAFLGTKIDFESYIRLLEPIANQFTYIAEALPQLYLQAQQYEKLIDIALSDNYLPENNPIDARNVRVYRLQFAFKAALKTNHYKDAIKLAMRAGEEVAGSQRQLALFQNNIDLLASLQSKEKVQEIAFKKLLAGGWGGSENVYTASLLSGIDEYQGEARGYLRAAINWLLIYFEEWKKNENRSHQIDVSDRDILELAYAHLNIFGVKECVYFLSRFTSKEWMFKVIKNLTRKLVDAGKFEDISEFLRNCKSEPYFTVAVTSELLTVGRFPESSEIEACLHLLCNSKRRIAKPKHHSFDDKIIPAIISFLETCLYRDLLPQKILRVIRHYVPVKPSRLVFDSHFSSERSIYLRAIALKVLLAGKTEIDIDEILPSDFVGKEKDYESQREIDKFKEVINGMFPWFFLRAKVLYIKNLRLLESVAEINEASKKARANRYYSNDTLPYEIVQTCASILIFYNQASKEEVLQFYDRFIRDDKAFRIEDRLNTLRASFRVSHLVHVTRRLEQFTHDLIKADKDNGPEEIANNYISLARAVMINSVKDASVYFEEAIMIVSKFGDELVQRWEAVVSLAKQSCNNKVVPDELAYRFIRCAELVGEYMSREKYWNRSEAMSVCTKMSPGIGISALSRWRDRDIGRFEYQFEATLHELVESKVITSSTGWALARFFSSHHLKEYLSICLEQESSIEIKQRILADAVHLLELEGSTETYWEKIKSIADIANINNERLNQIIDFYRQSKDPSEATSSHNIDNIEVADSPDKKWDDFFNDFVITTSEGFADLLLRFKSRVNKDDYGYGLRGLLKEILNRIKENSLLDFLDVLLTSDSINHYDVQETIKFLPEEWINRVSFKKKWPEIVFRFGQQYSHELTSEYAFDSFVKDLNIVGTVLEKLKAGIFSGLADGYEFADANIFFGFVSLASSSVEAHDSLNLLDFSLSRFELHIENDFGDGVWSNWLQVSDNVNKNIAGFIWSALGSPRSAVRWNAVHCVRVLSKLKCTEILDYLIDWLEYNKVDAFGSNQFPFYNLHARLYLLISLARVSMGSPELLLRHHTIFSKYALSEPHILIQKFSSDIAINIEKAFPGTYDSELLTSIKGVGKSKMAIQEQEYDYSTDSYLHEHGGVDTTVDFHFGWDFERYWFEPLGDVFGVPGKQVEDLAGNLIVNEWGWSTDSTGYRNDPRVILWNRSSSERETSHDHGSYPRTDNLDFYLSYHSMLVVAARLIEKMPVISKREWYEDEWIEWLSSHLLTRNDGKWLADSRDPLPLERPKWVFDNRNETWQSDILDDDFIDWIKIEDNGEVWINVNGNWQEKKDERTESFFVSSALVSKETADSLLRALATCSDPHDYKLPNYGEENMEIDSDVFQLHGWINERSISKRLDEFDPYADRVDYPPYTLGDAIKERLGLTLDHEGKLWFANNFNEIALICETWASYRERRDEEPDQSGMRLKANLSFLKDLCNKLDCELIFDVGIKREISYRHSSSERKYAEPQHKIFILSEDGTFRTTEKSNQLR